MPLHQDLAANLPAFPLTDARAEEALVLLASGGPFVGSSNAF